MLVSHNPDEKEEFAVLSERTIEYIFFVCNRISTINAHTILFHVKHM